MNYTNQRVSFLAKKLPWASSGNQKFKISRGSIKCKGSGTMKFKNKNVLGNFKNKITHMSMRHQVANAYSQKWPHSR